MMEGPAPSRASAWRVACGAMPGFNGLVASSVPHPQLNADGVCPPHAFARLRTTATGGVASWRLLQLVAPGRRPYTYTKTST